MADGAVFHEEVVAALLVDVALHDDRLLGFDDLLLVAGRGAEGAEGGGHQLLEVGRPCRPGWRASGAREGDVAGVDLLVLDGGEERPGPGGAGGQGFGGGAAGPPRAVGTAQHLRMASASASWPISARGAGPRA